MDNSTRIDPLEPYRLALKELGQKEIPGHDDNERIVYYHSFTTLKATDDETPWCSSFVCCMSELAGFISTRSARARSWIDFGTQGIGKLGDLAVFTRQSGGHVAFVNKDYMKGADYIECLGGNQNNSVCIKLYPAKNLITFRSFK